MQMYEAVEIQELGELIGPGRYVFADGDGPGGVVITLERPMTRQEVIEAVERLITVR